MALMALFSVGVNRRNYCAVNEPRALITTCRVQDMGRLISGVGKFASTSTRPARLSFWDCVSGKAELGCQFCDIRSKLDSFFRI